MVVEKYKFGNQTLVHFPALLFICFGPLAHYSLAGSWTLRRFWYKNNDYTLLTAEL